METLDYKHIANLVSRAQSGDSNAFAELNCTPPPIRDSIFTPTAI